MAQQVFNIKKTTWTHFRPKKYTLGQKKLVWKTSKDVLKGIYTVPENESNKRWEESFKGQCKLRITTKQNSKMFFTRTEEPIQLYYGGGKGIYPKLYAYILAKMDKKYEPLKNDVKQQKSDLWIDAGDRIQHTERDTFGKRFKNELYKELKKSKVDIVQNGGEFIIINPKSIEKTEIVKC